MREFKFRAWDTEKKRFWYIGLYNHLPSNWQDFYDIQQYTGLKDSKGHEIYEGDIVKQRSPIYPKITPKLWAVVYDAPKFHLKHTLEYAHENIIPDYCEVIGNIYEGSNTNKGGEKDES